ncbi:hypothetical protein V5O48_018144 [Marasmius crinis-equi]|uniref:CxC2-like cysteine cluster KDZ transposase-associated domain-containing protein n=1 Tax=Marasmius crinis-equi TaxID=585013 RepID=A0ABR3EM11_9AGAR
MERPERTKSKPNNNASQSSGFMQLQYDRPATASTPSTSITLSSVSQDGRRIQEREVPFHPPSPEVGSRIPPSLTSHPAQWEIGSQDFTGRGIMGVDGILQAYDEDESWPKPEQMKTPEILVAAPTQASCCYISSDNPFLEMKAHAGVFLKELAGLAQIWNGSYFETRTLKSLGIFIQTGHPPQEGCRCFMPAREGFVVVDIDYVQEVMDRYDEFTRAMRLWRYLKLLRRGGIPPSDVLDPLAIAPGQLAVRCPACPRVEINLPPDWEELVWNDSAKAFLFFKFISVDACFCLKQRAVSTKQKDPGLVTGKAYFVEQGDYHALMQEMKKRPEQKEEGHCLGSTLSSIAQANMKFSKGYTQTGCMLCLCARHKIVEPNRTVDFNKGEQLCYLGIATAFTPPAFCLEEDMPDSVRLEMEKDLWQFVVPNRPTAKVSNASGPVWALSAPAHRKWGLDSRDRIDDHLGSWNWQKIVGLGFLLRKQRRDVRLQIQAQGEFFRDFLECQSGNVEQWGKMVADWENSGMDADVQNPYSRALNADDEHDVRLRYALEEANNIRIVHDLSPSAFVLLGLDIEDMQHRLLYDVKENNFDTALQQTTVAKRRGKILRQIAKFRTSQRLYTPLIAAMIAQLPEPDPNQPPTPAETTPLYMPSELSPDLCNHADMRSWVAMETEYRRAQLKSSLEAIRTHPFVETRLHAERSLHIRHQKGNTRARQSLERNRRKITENMAKYQHTDRPKFCE